MSDSAGRGRLEEHAWVLIPLSLASGLVYLPLGLVAGVASAVYAHVKRRFVVRNILLALLTVPILLLSIFQS